VNNHQRRLKSVELNLTPQQVVLVWLRNAIQAGTFEDGALQTPAPRAAVANAVFLTVRNSMKGQSQLLVERAVLQARQEADLLYNLVVRANAAVLENVEQREREYFLLLGYLRAELVGTPIEGRIGTLRLALLMFVESVVVLDAAISRVVAEHMSGQPVLFRDCADNLQRQVEMAARLSGSFNCLGGRTAGVEINLEEVRDSLRAQIDEGVASWFNLARLEMLSEFGQEAMMRTVLERILRRDDEQRVGRQGAVK
jgi:hypothetical protein